MKNTFFENNKDLRLYDEQVQQLFDEYVVAYVNEKMVPAEEVYRNIFGEINDKIDEINSQLFVKTNTIQSEINEYNKNIREKSIDLTKIKKINGEYKAKLFNMDGKENASFLLTDDTFEIYKYQYIINWSLIIAIFVLIYTIYKSFNKKIG
jgi:hypothetical protein